MDVGAALREARERRGISLEELARATKIGVATFRALERNQVDHLPGGIFLRGFLKAYARQVELDPEDTVRRYVAQFERLPAAAVPTETAGTELESTPPVHHDADGGEWDRRATPMRVLMVGLALALCAVALVITLPGLRTPQSRVRLLWTRLKSPRQDGNRVPHSQASLIRLLALILKRQAPAGSLRPLMVGRLPTG